MSERDLLTQFALLMRMAQVDQVSTVDEDDADSRAAPLSDEEQGRRLARAFQSIRSQEVRQAILDVVTVIARWPH